MMRLKINMNVIVYSFLSLLLLLLVVFSMAGEKVAYNGGSGWDGEFYREVTFDFLDKIFSHGYDSYRIQRILPFGIVNIIFKVFDIPQNITSSMFIIQLLNFLTLFVGIVVFFLIVSELRLSLAIGIIGFSSLFFNYPILKLLGYYPYLTDTYALVFALMQFYFFIKWKRVFLVVISIVGAFIWPTLFMSGLILAFAPKKRLLLSENLSKGEKNLLIIIKALSCISIPIAFLILFTVKRDKLLLLYSGDHYSSSIMLIISLAAVSLYLFYAIKPIKLSLKNVIWQFVLNIKLIDVISFIMIFLCVMLFIKTLSNGEALVSLSYMIVSRILIPPTVDPFVFIVTTFMYFGPIVIFIILFWNKIIVEYANYGYSFFIIILMGLIMSLNTESRHLLSFIPFFIFPVLSFLSRNMNISLKVSTIFALACLTLSRFWYRINVPGIEKAFSDPIENKIGNYLDFPAQRLFMSLGPWMSHGIYLIFTFILVVNVILIYAYIKYIDKNKIIS